MKKKIKRSKQYIHNIAEFGLIHSDRKRYVYVNDEWAVLVSYGKPASKSVREPRKIKKRRNAELAQMLDTHNDLLINSVY
jgi:hypothetical protein